MQRSLIACTFGIWAAFSGTAEAQDTLRVMFYAPGYELARALQRDIVDAPEWEKVGLYVEMVEASTPHPVALAQGSADIVFVQVDLAQREAVKPLGFADILAQPFNRLDTLSVASLLRGGYRDFLLADLEQEDAIALSFASLGASSLIARAPIEGPDDAVGSKWALASPGDRGFDQLGVVLQDIQPDSMYAAAVTGRVDAVEVFDPELVETFTAEFPNAGVLTDLQPFLLTALVQSDFWRARTEDQRLAIRAVFDRAEAASLERAVVTRAALERASLESGGFHVLPFAAILTEKFIEGQRAAWIDGDEARNFVLSIFEASLEAEFNGQDHPPRTPSPDDRGDLDQRRIWFATDRELFPDAHDFERTFGVRSMALADGRYRCGAVTWGGDGNRQLGEPIDRGLTFDGPIVDEAGCSDLLGEIAESSDKRILLFIHGYNTRFPAAAARVAALKEDLRWKADVMLWSWPSAGDPGAYIDDGRAIGGSRWRLVPFLEAVVAAGIERVDLIAHSMGGRLGIEALAFAGAKPSGPFMHAVFVAPDVPTDDFSNAITASQYPGHVTLYANEHDRALMASLIKNGTSPAGLAGLYVLMMNGLETVDASEVDNEPFPDLNHAHAFDVPEALGDLVVRLGDESPAPGNRQIRREPPNGTPIRWIIEKHINVQ